MMYFCDARFALVPEKFRMDIVALVWRRLVHFHLDTMSVGPGVLADAGTRLVSFERNKSGVGRGDDFGDLPFNEVDADSVKARLLTLIRELFSDR